MTTKAQRRNRIIELLSDFPIRNQQMLQSRLALEGINVTQATLSRDLNEMGVLKSPDRYLPPANGTAVTTNGSHVRRSLEQSLLSIDWGSSMVVLRTPPGHANALAVELDREREDDVLGTIAGDDTIFIAVRSAQAARTLVDRLKELVA